MYHSDRYKKPITADNGVLQWLIKHRFLSSKNTQYYDMDQEFRKIIRAYMNYKGIEIFYNSKKKTLPKIHVLKNCQTIQKDFKSFKEYMFQTKISKTENNEKL